MYKSEKTTYVVRGIPVTLWKKVKSKILFTDQHKNIGDLIINLLGKWVQEENSEHRE